MDGCTDRHETHFIRSTRSWPKKPKVYWPIQVRGTGQCRCTWKTIIKNRYLGRHYIASNNRDLISHQSWDGTTNLMIVEGGRASRAKKDKYEANGKRHFRQVRQFTGFLQTNERHDRCGQKLNRTNENVSGFGAWWDAMHNVRVAWLRSSRCLCCRCWERAVPCPTWSQTRCWILILPRTSLPTTSITDQKWMFRYVDISLHICLQTCR